MSPSIDSESPTLGDSAILVEEPANGNERKPRVRWVVLNECAAIRSLLTEQPKAPECARNKSRRAVELRAPARLTVPRLGDLTRRVWSNGMPRQAEGCNADREEASRSEAS